jgi:hypothetical protein
MVSFDVLWWPDNALCQAWFLAGATVLWTLGRECHTQKRSRAEERGFVFD